MELTVKNVVALLAAFQLLIILIHNQSNFNQVMAAQRKTRCPAEREVEMDTCASRMGFLGDHMFKVPKNDTSMGSFCSQLKDSISCIQNYSRDCLTGFTKQILTGLLKRGKQQYNSICQLGTSRAEFMTKMSCLTDNKIDRFHSCMDASIARFEFIRSQIKPEYRLPSLCCSYQIFFVDTSQTLNSICGQNSEATKFVHKLVTGTAGEFITLICDGHRNMDECRTSSKTGDSLKKLEQVTQQAKMGKLKPKSKSLIPPLLDILDTSN